MSNQNKVGEYDQEMPQSQTEYHLRREEETQNTNSHTTPGGN